MTATSSGVAVASFRNSSWIAAEVACSSVSNSVAAIMGGHDEPRGPGVYNGVARIAAALCREDF